MDAQAPIETEPPAVAVGRVHAVFSSLQGEGPFVGERHLFIRLAGCPWRCRYCDTPEALIGEQSPAWSVEETLARVREEQARRTHATAAVTGGEPLIQSDFLAALLPALKGEGFRTLLETSATHPQLFARLTPFVDVVAADIKPPSAIGRPFWAEHEQFLRLAGERAYVKLVLTAQITDEEVDQALGLLAGLQPTPPLVLQPVTPVADLFQRLGEAGETAPSPVSPPAPARVVAIWDHARARLPVVKLIAQMHPVWGLP